MSTLTKEQRDALPLDDFGDPKHRLFPILDQDDVDSSKSLIGKADDPDAVKRRIIAIATRKDFRLPDAWQDGGAATHSAEEYVTRRGKIFECGAFPDKRFALTPEEALAAIADFRPVPLDLEHTPTVLQSKLGTLDRVEMGEDGWTIYGEVRLPSWLDAVLSDDERKVSCTWDRDTKRLVGLALVRTPRVTDAALMAAFAGKRHSATDLADMQQVHDIAKRQGAACAAANEEEGTDPMADPTEQTLMSKFFAWLTAGGAQQAVAPVTFSAPPETPAPSAPTDAEKDALRDELAKLRAQQIADRAAAFAAEQITAKKALPAQRDAIIAAYSVAAADDAAHGLAAFASGRGSRVDALSALFGAAPAHGLTTELVPVDPAAMRQLPTPGQLAGFSQRLSEGVDAKEVIRLLGSDPVGKTILRDMAMTASVAGGLAGK